jgi:hypothetical protein
MARQMKVATWAGVVLAALACSNTGLAAPASIPATESSGVPRLEIAGTGFVGLAFGERCPASTSDAVVCTLATGVWGARLSPLWRVVPHVAFGLTAAVAWVPSEPDVHTKWWDAQLVGRYYFGKPAPLQFWLDGSAGIAAAVDSLPAYVSFGGTALPASTITTWAPAFAMGVGFESAIERYLRIAPGLRGQFYGVRRNGPNGALYGSQFAVLLEISIVAVGAYR